MGNFDTIRADLECAVKNETKEREILFKWRPVRDFSAYHIGDVIEDILPKYDNKWIRADYICESCSKLTPSPIPSHKPYVKVDDQQRHPCYVRMENKAIAQVLSEKDFQRLGIEDYVDDL